MDQPNILEKSRVKGLPRRPDPSKNSGWQVVSLSNHKSGLLAMTQKREAQLLKLFSLIIIVSFSAAGCNQKTQSPPPPVNQIYDYSHRLQIGAQTLNVEIANTPAAQQQGLSGRKFMADNQGMLFEFSAEGGSASGGGNGVKPAFWMKDMNFDLDFIWIADDKVVGITSDINHPNALADPLPTYSPPQPVNWVLEVNAGWAKKNNIAVGDVVKLITNN